jgi:hypothetical protein
MEMSEDVAEEEINERAVMSGVYSADLRGVE